jgi:large subunit ribosomal protein L10
VNKTEKAAVVEELAGDIRDAEAIFAVDYRGISVPQAATLRGRLRDVDTRFRIVKNTLTERAADQAGVDGLKELLDGPTALAFVRGDAAAAAKALSDTARATNVLAFKGGLMNGSALSAEDVQSIARLPGRDALYGQLVGVVASPVTSLVRGLNQLIAGLAIALQQVQDEGKVGQGAPAEAAPAAEAMPAEEAPAEAAAGAASEETPSLDAQEDAQKAAEEEPPADPDKEAPEGDEPPQPDQAEGEPGDVPAAEDQT